MEHEGPRVAKAATSVTQGTLHGRRKDLPPRLALRSKKRAGTLASALTALAKDKYTPTSRKSVGARARWWLALSEAHGGSPFPIDKEKLRKGAAR